MLHRFFNHSRIHRIKFDLSSSRQQMTLVQYTRTESTLKEVAAHPAEKFFIRV
jgi:hypothetical protein